MFLSRNVRMASLLIGLAVLLASAQLQAQWACPEDGPTWWAYEPPSFFVVESEDCVGGYCYQTTCNDQRTWCVCGTPPYVWCGSFNGNDQPALSSNCYPSWCQWIDYQVCEHHTCQDNGYEGVWCP
jgi:hypothetical protein